MICGQGLLCNANSSAKGRALFYCSIVIRGANGQKAHRRHVYVRAETIKVMSHFGCNQDSQSTCGGAQPRHFLLSHARGAFLIVRDAIIPENFTFMSNEHTRDGDWFLALANLCKK
jgi:hypothetical protein